MNTRRTALVAGLWVVLGWPMLAGCDKQAPAEQQVAAPPPAPAKRWVRSELYFGLSKPDKSQVTREEWGTFIANEVLPRFPDGLTIVEGLGQWRGKDGKQVVEPSRILIVLHAANAEADRKIQEIRAIYLKTFGQEAVMRVRSEADVDF